VRAPKVIDSYALIAYFDNEPGADAVTALIKEARDRDEPLLMSVVNWGEVYYIVSRTAGKAAADGALEIIDTLPIDIVPADRPLARSAAEIKAGHKLSFADCFAAALAKSAGAELITGDPEFKGLKNELQIRWIA
jgi:ribonuclease VapC